MLPKQNSYETDRSYQNRIFDTRKKHAETHKQRSANCKSRKASSESRWYQIFSRSVSKKEEKQLASSTAKGRKHVSKPTSWTFVQAQSSVTNQSLAQPGVTDHSFERRISVDADIHIRSHRRKMEKQQVFSMLPATAHSPTNLGPGKENETKDSSLRHLLLIRNTPFKRRHLASETHLSDVSRNPGPVDGSLYASVNKKKTLRESSSLSSLPQLREYPENRRTSQLCLLSKNTAGSTSQIADGSRKSSFTGSGSVIHVDIKEGDVKLVGPPQKLDLLANVVNTPPEEENGPISPTYQRIEDVNAVPRRAYYETIAPIKVTSNFAVSEIKLDDSPLVSEQNESFSFENVSMQFDDSDHENNDKRKKRTSKSFNAKSEIQENKVKVVLSKSISLPCINDSDDMSYRGKSHLTKQQVHEAMEVINECLSDQQLRSGNLFPQDVYFTYSKANPLQTVPPQSSSMQNLNTRSDRAIPKQLNIFSETYSPDILDDVIAELSGLVPHSPVKENTPVESYAKKSKDRSNESSDPSTVEPHQQTNSCSDVDSGIDGSALTGSVSSDAKSKNIAAELLSGQDAAFVSSPVQNSKDSIGNATTVDAEESEIDEERKVKEEIEKMQRRLEQLQEKQMQLQQQRKRHSFDGHALQGPAKPVQGGCGKENMYYATLPKSPEKARKVKDMKLNFRSKSQQKVFTNFSNEGMMSTAYSADRGQHHSTFGQRSPGFNTPDRVMAERANVFTPAYAHPMHQPNHKSTLQYHRQKQDEEKKETKNEKEQWRKEEEEKRNKHESRKQNFRSQIPAKQLGATPAVQGQPDDLQSQLDELDQYILELTQDYGPPEQELDQNTSDVRRSYSFSANSNNSKERDNLVAFGPKSASVYAKTSSRPPKPPSRDTSSFDSVSRRQFSSGIQIDSMKAKCSDGRGLQNVSKDDEVFTSQGYSQPSYPPQTRHTRPFQQQVVAHTPPPSKSPPQKMGSLEDRLSPQLFIAMTVNPGGRPVEEIHSYKEDLAPVCGMDTVDSAPPGTPGFPVSPPTPYVNDKSPISGHFPAGLVKTPLSALGLKHNPHPDSVPHENSNHNFSAQSNSILRQNAHLNGPVTNSSKESFQGRIQQNGRLVEPHPLPPKENLKSSPSPENIHGVYSFETKQTLLSNNSHDSGYADSHPNPHVSTNGWIPSASAGTQMRSHNELQHQDPFLKRTGPAFAYQRSSTDRVSPGAPRSLSGSNDSLLSNGSSSNHSQNAYQQHQRHTSQPALPPKESSFRHSGNSIKSSSTGSGYLPGSSQVSPHSTTSPGIHASGHHVFSSHQPVQRRESQLSAYDQQGTYYPPHNNVSSDDGLGSPTSARTSSSSFADLDKLAHDLTQASLSSPTPKFIKDTTSFWYKPDITRDQALAMLRHRKAGSFVVRDSRCYPGAFGLALKVQHVPSAVLATAKPGTDMSDELVRHFLIEPSTRGVKLKGCVKELVFGSLSALIYQHSITPIALPCKLVIPVENQEVPLENESSPNSVQVSNTATELLRQGAACNVLYLGSVGTELLTGPEAVDRSIRDCIQSYASNNGKTAVVHFKVSPQGITLTDNGRKIFFRRHYPTATINYCGMDPKGRDSKNRRWNATEDRGPPDSRMFGFVARKSGSSVDNTCHVFAELDLDQPAHAIVNFVSKILIGSG